MIDVAVVTAGVYSLLQEHLKDRWVYLCTMGRGAAHNRFEYGVECFAPAGAAAADIGALRDAFDQRPAGCFLGRPEVRFGRDFPPGLPERPGHPGLRPEGPRSPRRRPEPRVLHGLVEGVREGVVPRRRRRRRLPARARPHRLRLGRCLPGGGGQRSADPAAEAGRAGGDPHPRVGGDRADELLPAAPGTAGPIAVASRFHAAAAIRGEVRSHPTLARRVFSRNRRPPPSGPTGRISFGSWKRTCRNRRRSRGSRWCWPAAVRNVPFRSEWCGPSKTNFAAIATRIFRNSPAQTSCRPASSASRWSSARPAGRLTLCRRRWAPTPATPACGRCGRCGSRWTPATSCNRSWPCGSAWAPCCS